MIGAHTRESTQASVASVASGFTLNLAGALNNFSKSVYEGS
jgi:hypothetical protein